ncbi:SGNH/GDSL hydrolase family protein [Xylocopilactobacillus apis]|uniref:SGNH hydrolase-type esterase domain-containing protein n=1 Tax=Xylocopilactobacillus apis TaxID=2932183 RepID=A0AAU9DST1_9LACO|nr:SGNH/GDSL hydrolase family protein [Xylocopilactobacillus apis]BDR56778.1 hypothetical protein KIMC2_13400 [Xylocopilactobacillus apis]
MDVMTKKGLQLLLQLATRIMICAFLLFFSLTLIAQFHKPLHTYEKTSVNPIRNQKIVIFGDSVSYGETRQNVISKYNYLPLAAKYLDAKSVKNFSIPGSGIMVNLGEGYTWQNILYAIKKNKNKVKEADIVIISAGRNDTVVPNLHKYQLETNLQNDINEIKKINKSAKIYGILPWDGLAEVDQVKSDYKIKKNPNGFTLTKVADILAEVYQKNNIYFFDPRKSTEEWENTRRSQFGDGRTHPTDLTYKKMASTMINWLTIGGTIKIDHQVKIKSNARLYQTAYDALVKNENESKQISSEKTMYCSNNIQYNGKYIITVYKNKSDCESAKNGLYVNADETDVMESK